MRNTKFEMNIEGRDFFVGDIHGEYDKFMAELATVDFDFDVDRVFSVGDLSDRGPNSVECLRLLHAPWFHAVLGNHEDFILGSHSYNIWLMNGGSWSNAVDKAELDELADLVNEKMHRTMTIDTIFGTVGVVHAESHDDWDKNNELTHDINTWARTRIRCKQDMPIKNIDQVVVGHSAVKEVVRLGNILYIDTGAVYEDGYLTLVDVHEVFNKEYKRVVGTPPKPIPKEVFDCF